MGKAPLSKSKSGSKSPKHFRTTTPGKTRRSEPSPIVEKNVATVNQLEESARDVRSNAEVIAEQVAGFCGSIRFVWVHVAWFGCWILFNAIPGTPHFDPFPFTLLTLVVSLEAIFLSTFILISQNHEARIAEKRNQLDLQINLLSEQENTRMLALLRAVAEKVGADLSHDPALDELSRETSPEEVAKKIEAHNQSSQSKEPDKS